MFAVIDHSHSLDIEPNTLTMCFIFVRYSLCAVTIIGIITRDGVIGNFSESLSEVTGSSPVPATQGLFCWYLFLLPTDVDKEESEVHLRG